MIRCAFDCHVQRVGICEGSAMSFFRTSKGTLWPLCRACACRHKELVLRVARDVDIGSVAGATFNIALDDPEALSTWRVQDPGRIQRIIQAVDRL